MTIFDGYKKWFDSYLVSNKGGFVTFSNSRGEYQLSINDIEDFENEYNVEFVYSRGCYFVFRIKS